MRQKAFTLIELLVVVAIIGILAMIVLPNFLSALVKAKVARSQADINSLVNSLMAYRVDNNMVPPIVRKQGSTTVLNPLHVSALNALTTPVAYISTGAVNSPFSAYHGYWYHNWEWFVEQSGAPPTWYWNNVHSPDKTLWMLFTVGPNAGENPYDVLDGNVIMWQEYDPSNGVSSRGVIQKHGT